MKKMNKANTGQRRTREIRDYDATDTTALIDESKPLKFADLGLKIPEVPPTRSFRSGCLRSSGTN